MKACTTAMITLKLIVVNARPRCEKPCKTSPNGLLIRVDAVTAGEQRISSVSGHIGLDATSMITPQIGVGLFLRYVGGSVVVPTLDSSDPVDVCGMPARGSGSASESGHRRSCTSRRPDDDGAPHRWQAF